MHKFTSTYGFGDIVYLKTDSDQLERMVVAIRFTCTGSITYTLVCGEKDSDHYQIELSSKKDLMKELNITNSNNA